MGKEKGLGYKVLNWEIFSGKITAHSPDGQVRLTLKTSSLLGRELHFSGGEIGTIKVKGKTENSATKNG